VFGLKMLKEGQQIFSVIIRAISPLPPSIATQTISIFQSDLVCYVSQGLELVTLLLLDAGNLG